TFVEYDQSLNAAVNRLREALRDSADKPRFIETLPKRGYRFIGVIERDTGESRPSAAADSSHAPGAHGTPAVAKSAPPPPPAVAGFTGPGTSAATRAPATTKSSQLALLAAAACAVL